MKYLIAAMLCLAMLVACSDTATEMMTPEDAPRYSRRWQALGSSEYIVVVIDAQTGESWTIWKAYGTEPLTSVLLRHEEASDGR